MSNVIDYTGENGYRGVMYGKSSMAIYDKNGVERLHTGARGINTLEELKEFVDGFEEFPIAVTKVRFPDKEEQNE